MKSGNLFYNNNIYNTFVWYFFLSIFFLFLCFLLYQYHFFNAIYRIDWPRIQSIQNTCLCVCHTFVHFFHSRNIKFSKIPKTSFSDYFFSYFVSWHSFDSIPVCINLVTLLGHSMTIKVRIKEYKLVRSSFILVVYEV